MSRSLSNLEVLEEYPLMSILRWSFKTNIIKTMSASDYGQISLVSFFNLFIIIFLKIFFYFNFLLIIGKIKKIGTFLVTTLLGVEVPL